MRWIVNLAKPTMTAILVAAPIGNTTVLLLFSLSLETLLTLLLFRERRLRLEAIAVERKTPVTLLRRTEPHLRARRPAFTELPIASSRWRTASSGATSRVRSKRAASGPVERHVPVAGL
jgi:hypothetical protein